MAGSAPCQSPLHGMVCHTQQRRGAFAGHQKMLGRYRDTASTHTVGGLADRIVQFQRAVPVAGSIPPSDIPFLGLPFRTELCFPGIAYLFQHHRGHGISGGRQGNVRQFHAPQQRVYFAAQRGSHNHYLRATFQMPGQIPATVSQRQNLTGQKPPHHPGCGNFQ